MEQKLSPNGTETCPRGCPLPHAGLTIIVGQPLKDPRVSSPGPAALEVTSLGYGLTHSQLCPTAPQHPDGASCSGRH